MTRQTTTRRAAADVSPAWEAFDEDYELQSILRAADHAPAGESFASLLRRAGVMRAAAQPPVRNFNCTPDDVVTVQRLVPGGPTAGQLKARVDAVARHAVSMIERAAGALERRPRDTRAAQCFLDAFGASPDVVPTWRMPGMPGRDLGGLIADRLRKAARILAGGHIGYTCLCNPAYPECRECPCTRELSACSSYAGRYNICLFRRFWTTPPQEAAVTLLHEALHIYFRREVSHGERGTRISNASCYEHFVNCLHGRTVPFTRTECATLLPPKITMRDPFGPGRSSPRR